ncbi:MAG: Nif3-like dinuclear metal center hexameric protein [Planctomycetota bacterium]
MPTVADVCAYLEEIAPLALAADWDNVGLLLGDPAAEVKKVMTCLTLTPDVAEEAVAKGVDLVVTHHPIFFKPVQRVTAETWEGAVILKLAAAGCAVYSVHTAWDDAGGGINDMLSAVIPLDNIKPIRPNTDGVGSGRCGRLKTSMTLNDVAARFRGALGPGAPEPYVICESGDTQTASVVGVACGSAIGFLEDAIAVGCDTFVTGEAKLHEALAARQAGVGLILLGHFASESFAMLELRNKVAGRFTDLSPAGVFTARESDPLSGMTSA